jgi:hypothetical protein
MGSSTSCDMPSSDGSDSNERCPLSICPINSPDLPSHITSILHDLPMGASVAGGAAASPVVKYAIVPNGAVPACVGPLFLRIHVLRI